MRKLTTWPRALPRLFFCALVIVAAAAYRVAAQDEGPLPLELPAVALDPGLLALITALVPIFLAGVRSLVSQIPSWVIPVAAPFVGALLDVVLYQTGVYAQQQPLLAAFFGMAGVGLREIVDQAMKQTGMRKT